MNPVGTPYFPTQAPLDIRAAPAGASSFGITPSVLLAVGGSAALGALLGYFITGKKSGALIGGVAVPAVVIGWAVTHPDFGGAWS